MSFPSEKPTFDFYLEEEYYGPHIRNLEKQPFYSGYSRTVDSRGKVWWSWIEFIALSLTKDVESGDFFLETHNTFYRVVLAEITKEIKTAGREGRYLPPLKEVQIDRLTETSNFRRIRGFDTTVSDKIDGEIYQETDDWYEVGLTPGKKRTGVIRYLKW